MRTLCLAVAIAAIGSALHLVEVKAETRAIDVNRSTMTVLVYKSGLFSAFADNHVIRARIATGSLSEQPPLAVDLVVRSADLQVFDPDLAASKRAEVQTRMLGPQVLDAVRYPDIAFASAQVDATGPDRWTVTGRLTIHGQTRLVTFAVIRKDGAYQGEVSIRQRDFGIEPIKVAGGTVRVRDELKVQFSIVASENAPREK